METFDTQNEAAQEFEETCQAIAEGLADIDAGRTIPFEVVRAQWEAEKAVRAKLSKRTGTTGKVEIKKEEETRWSLLRKKSPRDGRLC